MAHSYNDLIRQHEEDKAFTWVSKTTEEKVLDKEPKKEDNSGIKYDSEKPELYLLPPLSLIEVGKVLTYGANKYSPDNWRRVPGLQERYTSAALRHLFADMGGEALDDETNCSHLAHAICCLLFKLEDKLLEARSKEEGLRKSQQ